MVLKHKEEELKNLYQIRYEWVKKRDVIRVEEANQSDITSLHAIRGKIEESESKIKDLDSEIQKLEDEIDEAKNSAELSNKDVNETNESTAVNLIKVREILKQESQNFNFNSGKKEFEKIYNLKLKLYDEMFKDLDKQLDFISSTKELMFSSVLFDKIYTSETIDLITEQKILEIRHDTENYKWYDRSVIISALALSLINFKFDSKKANLLLDFVIDFEQNVWERALTGLTIAIIYQKNRSWLRANNLINRLITLQNNEFIQNGLKIIDFILKNELYKDNLFYPDLFKLELFKNPMHSFVPFYKDNDILKSSLDNAENDFDIAGFQDYLNSMPLMDSHKYALCIALSEGKLIKRTLKDERAKKFANSLMLSDYLNPYQNIISEYYFFFNNFPDKLKDDVFRSQLLLSKTELKKYILGKVMQLLLEANTLQQEESYSEAIKKYEDLLRIDKSHLEAQYQLGCCHLAIKGIKHAKNALNVFIDLEQQMGTQAGTDLLYKIALTLHDLEEYSRSNEYCNKLELKDKNPSFKLLYLRADNYDELDESSQAAIYCQKAEEKTMDDEDLLGIAKIYGNINMYDETLRLLKKIHETQKNKKSYWSTLGVAYCESYEWDLAIQSLKKSLELDKKYLQAQFALARTYTLSNLNLTEAKKIFTNLLNGKNEFKSMVYGNLGHLYMIEGYEELAFENYTKCIEMLNSEKSKRDFVRRMEVDLRFMIKLGIKESSFQAIKKKVVKQYLNNKK